MTSSKVNQNELDHVDASLFALGQTGILVRFGDGYSANPLNALHFGEMVREKMLLGVVDVATSLTSVLVGFSPQIVSRAALTERLKALLAQREMTAIKSESARLWTIPTSFGDDSGPQLRDAAQIADCTPEQAIADITGQDLSVLAIGFAPGQPYIGHLPENWNMPRQSALTPHVPAGALVVALRQLVLFANPSPTGWRWIGTCAFAPFQADRAEPFALRANDRIRFTAVDCETIKTLRANQADGLGGAVCEVLS